MSCPVLPSGGFEVVRFMHSQSLARQVVVLGLLMAVGPFAIDMYLPGFAAIASAFATSEAEVQLSLVSFFVAMALGQVIYGPLSDMIGRRIPVLAGLGLFVVASVGCAFATSIDMLIALRFVQGLGGAAGGVVTMAVIRDLATGARAARLMALSLLGLSLSPILAPVAGGALVSVVSWRAIFVALALIGAAVIVLVMLALPETLPPARRQPAGLRGTLASYGALFSSGWFLTAVLAGGGAQAVLFAYIAGSPFVLMTLGGLSPLQYSLVFALNAAGIIGGAQFNSMLITRFGARRVVSVALCVLVPAALALAGAEAAGLGGLPVVLGLVFVSLASLGLVMPNAMLLALEPFGARAGAAAALGGALQMLVSSAATALVSAGFDGTARSMVFTMALGALVSAAFWLAFLRRMACNRAA